MSGRIGEKENISNEQMALQLNYIIHLATATISALKVE